MLMPAVTIRGVPDETRNELAARAARGGRSLQEFLRQALIDMVAKPDINELLDEVHRRKQATGSRLSAEHIIASRDADRR
jgi:plasmid stability protein